MSILRQIEARFRGENTAGAAVQSKMDRIIHQFEDQFYNSAHTWFGNDHHAIDTVPQIVGLLRGLKWKSNGTVENGDEAIETIGTDSDDYWEGKFRRNPLGFEVTRFQGHGQPTRTMTIEYLYNCTRDRSGVENPSLSYHDYEKRSTIIFYPND